MTESLESKIKRLERDLEQRLSEACRAETIRVLELLRAQDDFAKSLDVGYAAIRERVAAGGPRGFMGGGDK
jgi:hypothetical protein